MELLNRCARKASSHAATTDKPDARALARSGTNTYTAHPDTSTVMNATMIGDAGGSEPHNNIQPYLTVNFCIATVGIFPARP